MSIGLSRYFANSVLANVATGTTPVATPTNVEGMAYVGFQVVGLGNLNVGGNGTGGGLGSITVQGCLGMSGVGSPTWVAVSVTNVTTNQIQGPIVADGIYFPGNVSGTTSCYFAYVRPMLTTLSFVENGRLDVFVYSQSETT